MELALQFMRSLGNGKLLEFNFSMGMVIHLARFENEPALWAPFPVKNFGYCYERNGISENCRDISYLHR